MKNKLSKSDHSLESRVMLAASSVSGKQNQSRLSPQQRQEIAVELFGPQVPGTDTIVGNTGNDRLRFRNRNRSVNLAGLGGDDVLIGGNGNDTLVGGLGNDRLIGGNGNDLFDGDPGDDVLTGGAGNDSFFIFENQGSDRITDFGRGRDEIQLFVSGIESFADLKNASSQRVRENRVITTIDVGGGNKLTVRSERPLREEDFFFGGEGIQL